MNRDKQTRSRYLCFSSSLCDDLKGQTDREAEISVEVEKISHTNFKSRDVRGSVCKCSDLNVREIRARCFGGVAPSNSRSEKCSRKMCQGIKGGPCSLPPVWLWGGFSLL